MSDQNLTEQPASQQQPIQMVKVEQFKVMVSIAEQLVAIIEDMCDRQYNKLALSYIRSRAESVRQKIQLVTQELDDDSEHATRGN